MSDRNISEIGTRYPGMWYRNMRGRQPATADRQTACHTGDVGDSAAHMFIDGM
jgi:hypothetical protein